MLPAWCTHAMRSMAWTRAHSQLGWPMHLQDGSGIVFGFSPQVVPTELDEDTSLLQLELPATRHKTKIPLAALIPQPSILYSDSSERLTTATVAHRQWPQDQCLHTLEHSSETTAVCLLHTNKAKQQPSSPGSPCSWNSRASCRRITTVGASCDRS